MESVGSRDPEESQSGQAALGMPRAPGGLLEGRSGSHNIVRLQTSPRQGWACTGTCPGQAWSARPKVPALGDTGSRRKGKTSSPRTRTDPPGSCQEGLALAVARGWSARAEPRGKERLQPAS